MGFNQARIAWKMWEVEEEEFQVGKVGREKKIPHSRLNKQQRVKLKELEVAVKLPIPAWGFPPLLELPRDFQRDLGLLMGYLSCLRIGKWDGIGAAASGSPGGVKSSFQEHLPSLISLPWQPGMLWGESLNIQDCQI